MDAGGYHAVAVDENHHLYREGLAPAVAYGLRSQSYYHQPADNPPYNVRLEGSLESVWLRHSVLQKLVHVNTLLRPTGLEVFLWDGYRSIETQHGLWAFFSHLFASQMNGQPAADIRAQVLKFVSDPQTFKKDDKRTWPGHTSGAAVDLTLCEIKTGHLVDMGAHFDQMDATAHSDHFERELAAGQIPGDHPPLIYRRILHAAMHRAGFVNYPLEYWHFDWGNQMFVSNLAASNPGGPRAAWYGYCAPPREKA